MFNPGDGRAAGSCEAGVLVEEEDLPQKGCGQGAAHGANRLLPVAHRAPSTTQAC